MIFTSSDVIKGTAKGHSGGIIYSILIKCLANTNKIFGLHTITEQESVQIEELDFQIEIEINGLGTNFFESKSIFRLKRNFRYPTLWIVVVMILNFYIELKISFFPTLDPKLRAILQVEQIKIKIN